MSNTCIEIYSTHRVGRTDKMSSGCGSVSLGVLKNPIGKPALEWAERRAMYMMNNDWHSGASRGQPAQYSRLAAMRVHNVRMPFAKNPDQIQKSEKIMPRGHGPDQAWHDFKQLGTRGKTGL